MSEEYMTIKQTADKWGMSERWVRKLFSQGKIEGGVQFGCAWAIPKDAIRLADNRIKS